MSDNSNIEWTDATWNPVAGCTPISPGCTNCYAATMARRLEAMGQQKYVGTAERRGKVDVFTGIVNVDVDALDKPAYWRKPKRIFVNSMSDLFHESVPFAFVDSVFATMERCERHTFQILTKRAERLSLYISLRRRLVCDPLPNVWLGVSVEDQQRADERIPHLLKTPAAVRFLSCEPLLGPLDLTKTVLPNGATCHPLRVEEGRYPLSGYLGHIHWAIVGGESGRNARPCNLEWIESIIEQCQESAVPCFVKQLGAVPFTPHPGIEWKKYNWVYDDTLELKSKKGGDPSEWPEHLRVRQFPQKASAVA